MSTTFWSDLLTEKKADYTRVSAAIAALETSGVQSYSLDTGQTRQVVTKLNLTELRKRAESLLSEISTLEVRCGGGATYGRPMR